MMLLSLPVIHARPWSPASRSSPPMRCSACKLGVQTVILGHLVFTQPFVILIVHARMASFDYSLLDARATSAPRAGVRSAR